MNLPVTTSGLTGIEESLGLESRIFVTIENSVASLEVNFIDKNWRRIDDCLSDLAFEDEYVRLDLYNATRILGDNLLSMPGVEGLFYPSRAVYQASFNIMLSTEAADRCLFPLEVWDCIVQGARAQFGTERAIEAVRRSDLLMTDGLIRWRDRGLEELQLEAGRIAERVGVGRAAGINADFPRA